MSLSRGLLLLALGLCACTGGASSPAEPGPPRPALAAVPSVHWVDDDGTLALPDDLPAGETPFPRARFTHRRGFSPAQTVVFSPDVALDPTSLPAFDGPGLGGTVQVWDLDDEVPVRAFAEVDLGAVQQGSLPSLMVRPLEPLPAGHRIGVIVSTDVRTEDGTSLARAPWLDAVLDDRPHPDLATHTAHYQDLVAQLERLSGRTAARVVDFPVTEGIPLAEGLLEATGVPGTHSLAVTDDADAGDDLPPGLWKRLEGTFPAPSWLVDDTALVLDDQGVPEPQGSAEVELVVFLPDSLRDTPAGEAPVWVFGHGIFAHPDLYFMEDDDPSGMVELADRAGALVVGTVWRGLTTADLGVAPSVGRDPGRFPELTDKLTQGLVNTRALVRLLADGDLLDDPLLMGLPDPEALRYHGISLGAIQGANLLAASPELPYGVLHVGGSSWSTLMERSQHWSLFDPLLSQAVPDAHDRQVFLATSQLFWDPVDPALRAPDLADTHTLWQVALGDDQVPNLTAWSLARGAGAPVLAPHRALPAGLDTVQPGRHDGPVVVQFDPEQGNDEDTNRPATDTTSHETPRLWEGTQGQALRYLDPDDPGVVEHLCGDTVCDADATGDP